MSFEEWIKSVPSMNTIERHVASIAYEAGQRDMREQCIEIVNKVGGIDISAHPSSYFIEIRAIKVGG